jgi:hypothetical protein
MSVWYYFARPTNLSFHYLTPGKAMPPAAKSLFRLSMKCIPTPRYTKYHMMPSLDRFERDLTVKVFWVGDESLSSLGGENEAPKLYVRSKWTPPPWDIPKEITKQMKPFRRAIIQQFRRRKGKRIYSPSNNVCSRTSNAIRASSSSTATKGLGPGGRFLTDYTSDTINGPLGDRRIYSHLSKHEASSAATRIKKEIASWISKYGGSLDKDSVKFLRKHLRENVNPFGYFYLLYKIHKIPMKTRPV